MTALLQLEHVAKSFGGTRALVDAGLSLHAGEVTALLGENGAGKSTLVKILTGVHRPDSGRILLDGQEVKVRSPSHARELGISVIHQESVIFDDLSVAENIFVGAFPRRRGFLDWRTMNSNATALLGQLHADIDPTQPLKDLSVARKHLVQIARALAFSARIVIMDEPTAALSLHEANELLDIVRRLRESGCAVLFISHKFEEVSAIADRYAVFRDGIDVGAGSMSATSLDALVSLMVGRPIEQVFPPADAPIGAEILKVDALSRGTEYADVSFSVARGEILGVYGLVGSGRSEVMQTLFGLNRPDSGRVSLDGAAVAPGSPAAAIAAGIAYVPEDRQTQGALLSMSIADNATLPSLPSLSRHGLIDSKRIEAAAREWCMRLNVKCRDPFQELRELSGGNQQKVVLAKWLMTGPRVLILDEPTKGIDIGSKAAVHELIRELARNGLAVVMVSSELPEVLGMADRVLVMRRGRVAATLPRSEATPEAVLRAATDA